MDIARNEDSLDLGSMFFFKADLLLEEDYRSRVFFVQNFNFLAMMFMLNILSIGFESNNALQRGHMNSRFHIQMAIQLICTVCYYILRRVFTKLSDKDEEKLKLFKWEVYPTLIVGLLIVALIQYCVQVKVQRLFEKDQFFLETNYQTKLGIWSPK